MLGYIALGASGIGLVVAQAATPDTPELLQLILTGGVPVITTYGWWRAESERKASNERALDGADRREKEWVPIVVEHTGVMREVKAVLERTLAQEAQGRRENRE